MYKRQGLCCPEGQALRVLAPGESIETPQVHFTLCASGLDALTQSRHRYVRECIMPVSYTHLDVYKRQDEIDVTPDFFSIHADFLSFLEPFFKWLSYAKGTRKRVSYF